MFVNRVLRAILRPKGDEVTREWRTLSIHTQLQLTIIYILTASLNTKQKRGDNKCAQYYIVM
jgi:predicted Abi (CAAX) family protease